MATAIGNLVVKLGAQTGGFDKAMRRSGMVAGATAAITNKAIESIAATARTAIRGVRSLGEEGLGFNAALRRSMAIMADVSEETRQRMKDTAFKAARDTSQSATRMAESYFFLTSAGKDVATSMLELPQVAKFATAGAMGLELATSLAADSQATMGMTSKNAARDLENLTRVTDVLVGANQMANASTQQFAEALVMKSGAAGRNLGKPIEEVVAALAVLARTVKGEQAGNWLSMAFRDLGTKSIVHGKEFRKAQVKVFDEVSGEMRRTWEIVKDLENAMGHLSDQAQRQQLLDFGFSDRSVFVIQAMLGTSGQMEKFYKRLENIEGATERVMRKQLGPFEKGWNELKVSITEAGSAMMDWASPRFGAIFESMSKSITHIQRFLENSPQWARFTELAEGAFSTVVDNLDVMGRSWEGFKEGFITLGRHMVHGFEAQVELMTHNFKTAWEEVRKWWADLWAGMQKDTLEIAMPVLTRLFERIQQMGEKVGDVAPAVASSTALQPWAVFNRYRRDQGVQAMLEARGSPGALQQNRSTLTDQERQRQVNAGIQQGIDGIDAWNTKAKSASDARMEEEDRIHNTRMKQIGEASQATSDLWESNKFIWRNLADQAEKEWAKFSLEGELTGESVEAFWDRFGGLTAADKAARTMAKEEESERRFAGAMEKGSQEAFSTVFKAGRDGDQIAKSQLKTQKLTLREIAAMRREAKQEEMVSIPV